jgi:seryl-tRNA synthetase
MTQAPTEPTATSPYSARQGLATLGPDGTALRTALEAMFVGWAAERDAPAVLYPPLVRVADLRRVDYFVNFPHLGILASGLTPDAVTRHGQGPAGGTPEAGGGDPGVVPAGDLAAAGYALPSATCYSVYFDLAGQVLPQTHRVTTVATCFRRESHYDQLRRLLGFTMREIVCVGEREAVLDHLAHYRRKVRDYLTALGLPVQVQTATDPFFDSSGSRALTQALFPVKEEFVYDGSLAVASVNFHRNFFGERCDIRTADGEPAFTGCVAFGIERWISALSTHFGGDLRAVIDRVTAADQ